MSRKRIQVFSIVSLIWMAGCQTTAQLSPQVADSLVELRHSLVTAKAQTDSTSQTLRDLSKSPRLNTQRQIELFHEQTVKLEANRAEVKAVAARMEEQQKEYYKAWSGEIKEVKNPEIAQISKERQKQSYETLKRIRDKMAETSKIFYKYMDDIKDIDRVLRQDETAEGVQALAPVINKVLMAKDTSIRKIDEIIAEIDRATRSVQ